MTKIEAKQHGILPGKQIGKQLNVLLSELSSMEGEKVLVFEQGTYYIDRDDCPKCYRAITNTTSAKEYKNPADVNQHYVAFLIEQVEDLTIEGNHSTFVLDGKMTNIILSDCKNVVLRNLKIDTCRPNLHKLTVKSKGAASVVFALDSDSCYDKGEKGYYWYGKGYQRNFLHETVGAHWIASIKESAPERIFRTNHPLLGAKKVKELDKNVFKVSYWFHKKFEIGQSFYIFDVHRSDVGIFLERCSQVTLDGVEQYFNYSLAYVAQDCSELTLENCRFAPKPGSGMQLASLADFMQVCMCSGTVKVNNCLFDGAGDDALNVHGIHFGIEKVDGRELTLAFRHSQTWGFNPLHNGDKVAFIDSDTMLPVAENRIVSSTMEDDKNIKVLLENEVPSSYKDFVIEDIDRCPSLVFTNNTANRIITRGILYTSRGKAVIANNRFLNNSMSGILLSDDAKNWFESGLCTDVTIENNLFADCGRTPVLIKPENRKYDGAVHSNVKLIGNDFCKYKGFCIKIKATDNVEIKNNQFRCGNPLKQVNCNDIKKDF